MAYNVRDVGILSVTNEKNYIELYNMEK
jgi:hypothetical protein